MINRNQKGAIDAIVIIVAVVMLVIGGFVFWRLNSSSDSNQPLQNEEKQAETTDELTADFKTLEEIEGILDINEGVLILSAEFETKDGTRTVKLVLSDGRKLIVNSENGKIISEERTDSPDESENQVAINVSAGEIYNIAVQQSSSEIKKIELETEDKKATYKVEYEDGSKLEIDATSGTILKSEIKNE